MATWDNIVLPRQQLQALRDIATHVRQRDKMSHRALPLPLATRWLTRRRLPSRHPVPSAIGHVWIR